jgi:hypothetical protein
MATRRQAAEYDGFGPWIYPVNGPEEMPPIFDPWYPELGGAALVLKLPKAIERRNAAPGDGLYEAVLAVGPFGVVHLRSTPGGIQRQSVAFEDIVAIRLELILLLGRLHFDLEDGEFEVVFNAVSAPLIEDFVSLVRVSCASRGGRPCPAGEGVSPPSERDSLFHNLLRELRRQNAGLAFLAYQAPVPLGPREEGGRRGLAGILARLLPWRLDGCLLADSPSGPIALSVSDSPRTRRVKGYRYQKLYIEAGSFSGAAVEERVLGNGAIIHALILRAKGRVYELLFERDPTSELALVRPGFFA